MRVWLFSLITLTILISGYIVLFRSSSNGATVMPQVLGSVTAEINTEQTNILNQINSIRRSAGVNELEYSAQLEELALYRVDDMVTNGYYSHKSPDGLNFASKLKDMGINAPNSCENLQLQIGDNISNAITAWINSPAHYRCLTDNRMSRVGMSYALHSEDVKSQDDQLQRMYVFALIAAN
jgi:uncharacterized protein YkwD